MTAPHSISSGSADAREPFERFIVRSGFTDLTRYKDGYLKPLVDRLWRAWPRGVTENNRTPALPSAEAEANEEVERKRFEFDEPLPTPQIAGGAREKVARSAIGVLDNRIGGINDMRDATEASYEIADAILAISPQPQPATPPFSRWADTIESASLAISPKGSEALNALAAEVRAGGAAQKAPDLRELLLEASLQIDYLHKKFQPTGTGETTLARIRSALSSTMPLPPTRPTVIGRVTGAIYEGDQVPGMPGAICHACGLKNYPCTNPDCPNKASAISSTTSGNAAK